MRCDHCKNALQYVEFQCFIYSLWPQAVPRAGLPRTTASGTGSGPIAHLSKLSNKWMQPPSKARGAGTSQESAV